VKNSKILDRILLLFVLTNISTNVLAQEQPSTVLDSIVIQDKRDHFWLNKTKTVPERDNGAFGTVFTNYAWDVNTEMWSQATRTFRSADSLVTYIEVWDAENEVWEWKNLVRNANNDFGEMQVVTTENWKDNQWIPNTKTQTEKAENSTETTCFAWDALSASWETDLKRVYRTDSIRHNKTVVTSKWNAHVQKWTPSKRTVYPECSDRKVIRFEHWKNAEWKDVRRKEVIVGNASDSYAKKTQTDRFDATKNTWEPMAKTVYSHVNGGIKTITNYTWDDQVSDWREKSRRIFYYSEENATPTQVAEEVKLYPNPCKDVLFVSTQEQGETCAVRIVDQLGKECIVKNVSHASVIALDVSTLAPGNYQIFVNALPAQTFVKR